MHSTFFVDAQWIFDTGPVISAFLAERHYNNQKAEGSTKAFASEVLTYVDFMSSLHEDMVVDPDQRRRY